MRRKGVVFSKMFVLRSMGNELVPSPQKSASFASSPFRLIVGWFTQLLGFQSRLFIVHVIW